MEHINHKLFLCYKLLGITNKISMNCCVKDHGTKQNILRPVHSSVTWCMDHRPFRVADEELHT